jgi:HTH-type transcriptional regulator/antitoxin HigA
MIQTDRQLTVTREELAKLQTALEVLRATPGESQTAWAQQAQADALQEQIADLETEIVEYELLKSGRMRVSEMSSLEELPRVLVQARIARGMSQTDLAELLNMKPQQVQRYEATAYMGASLARLIEVARSLGVRVSETFSSDHGSGSLISWSDPTGLSWDSLPAREMAKRGWFAHSSRQGLIEAARSYVLASAGPQLLAAMHRKKVRSGATPDAYALLAWQARILHLTENFLAVTEVPRFQPHVDWLRELASLSRRPDGPRLAKDVLARHGIALVVERHLPGTYLDGAAMLTGGGVPVVALTLRHDRLDNFWFVLFHELGHIFRHLFEGIRFDFFDDVEAEPSDKLEQEADMFALEALIPSTEWSRCLSRFAMSADAVRTDAERIGVHESIVAGRIRKERSDFMILTELVGQNEVRQQFEEYEQ